jgi:hypothetical protein
VPHTDRGLGRRLQLQQGLIWLAAARGDAYAALLRGLDTNPADHWRALSQAPLDRSATGDWVTARHDVVRAAQAEPTLRDQCLLEDGTVAGDPAPGAGAQGTEHVPRAWDDVLATVSGEMDVVALARDAALGMLAGVWGLDPAAENELHAAFRQATGALDVPFYPQDLARTRGIADGLATLRRLVPDTAPALADVADAVAAVEVATALVAGAVAQCGALAAEAGSDGIWERLATEPGHAERVVHETLRWASPLQLHAVVASAPCELAGRRVETGERVVLALGAANRDPGVFPDPDRFDPDRFGPDGSARQHDVLVPGPVRPHVLSFALACAQEGLRHLARLRPVVVAAPVRRSAAPVSRSPITCPVATI